MKIQMLRLEDLARVDVPLPDGCLGELEISDGAQKFSVTLDGNGLRVTVSEGTAVVAPVASNSVIVRAAERPMSPTPRSN